MSVAVSNLQPGGFYRVTIGGALWEIVSVGPKWITFREWYEDYGTGPMRPHARRRVLRRGWEGGAPFAPVDPPARKEQS